MKGNLLLAGPVMGPNSAIGLELIQALFVLVCGVALAALYLHDRRQCVAALRNYRWERVLHYLGMLALGWYQSGYHRPSVVLLITAALAVGLAWGSAVASNDLADLDIDRLSNPDRPLVAGTWSPRAFGQFAIVQGGLAMVGGICVNIAFALCLGIYLLVAFIYSNPPLRLKKSLGVSTSLVALASVCIVLAGFVATGDHRLTQFPAPVAAFLMVAFTCGVNFKDIKDYEGDLQAGMLTVVTLGGLRRGKIWTAALMSVGFLSAPAIFGRPDLWLPAGAFSLVAAGLVTREHFREKPLFFLYYAYFGVLLAAGLFHEQGR